MQTIGLNEYLKVSCIVIVIMQLTFKYSFSPAVACCR